MVWYNPASWFRRDSGLVHGIDINALADRVVDPTTGHFRADAWQNIMTLVGTAQDKRSGGRFRPCRVTSAEARLIWEADSLGARFVEALPADATRRGFKVKLGDLKLTEKLHASIEDHKLVEAHQLACEYERVYGGAGVWPILNDKASAMATPLNRSAITGVRDYLVFEPRELVPERWYMDASAGSKYGTPELYRIVAVNGGGGGYGTQQVIHESRLVRYMGIRASREQSNLAEYGWGVSEMTRVNTHLRDLNLDWGSVHVLLSDFSQGVYMMDGLAQLIDDNRDDVVVRKIMMTDIVRSVLRSVIIDTKDKFERQQTPVAGLSDLIVQGMTWFAAQCDMPVTRLFGVSPAGLNATGESDIALWDDRVEAYQTKKKPQLEELVSFELLALDGPTRGKEPDEWSIEHNPLRQPTAKEKAETELIIAQRDKIWVVDCEMVSREEATASHWQGDTFSADIVIDWKARKAQELAADPVVKPEPEVPIDPVTGLPVPAPDPNAPPTSGATPPADPGKKPEPAPKKKPTSRSDFIELQIVRDELASAARFVERVRQSGDADEVVAARRVFEPLMRLALAELEDVGFDVSVPLDVLLRTVDDHIATHGSTATVNGVH